MARTVSALALLLCFAACAAAQFFAVNPETKFIVDQYNRSRIFHGVNAVYKVPPWHPDVETYSTQYSLTDEDCAALAGWGFTSVRLGMMWPGVSVARGEFNTSYLAVMEGIVNCLGSNGIAVLLDAHQDVFSRFYCGEGVPDWAVNASWAAVPFPQPVAATIAVNASTGYPLLSACLEKNFAEYYFSDAVAASFQALYDNTEGLQTEFAAFWSTVAEYFASNPYVLGYELINEPWGGNPYADPRFILEPGYGDKKNLAPMYENLNAAIRAVDESHIVFFEPAVSDLTPSGLTQVPGGPAYNDRAVFSFHVYCGPFNASGDPTNVPECDAATAYLFDTHMSDARRLGGGMFMTEFGAMQESETETEVLEYLLGLADQFLLSQSYWQYKSYMDLTTQSLPSSESFFNADGSLQTEKVKTLARTYAYAIAGVPTEMNFDPATALFTLTFVPDAAAGAPTEIFFSSEFYYPNGIDVAISPPLAATFAVTGPNRLAVTAAAFGAPITVTISPQSTDAAHARK